MDLQNQKDALSRITHDRHRTNFFKKHEQDLLAFLVQRVPAWITSDMLTATGLAGSIVTATGFVLANYFGCLFLLLSILGFLINWLGDSLDGRLAYFRNKPRKWYGFTLDLTVDWLTNILIGVGFIVYVFGIWEIFGFFFVVLYGWAIMIALLRYQITGIYSIDSGLLGPTEVRIIISLLLILEIIFPGSIIYSCVLSCVILLIINVKDFLYLLKAADKKDKDEHAAKQ